MQTETTEAFKTILEKALSSQASKQEIAEALLEAYNLGFKTASEIALNFIRHGKDGKIS